MVITVSSSSRLVNIVRFIFLRHLSNTIGRPNNYKVSIDTRSVPDLKLRCRSLLSTYTIVTAFPSFDETRINSTLSKVNVSVSVTVGH